MLDTPKKIAMAQVMYDQGHTQSTPLSDARRSSDGTASGDQASHRIPVAHRLTVVAIRKKARTIHRGTAGCPAV